MNALNIQTGWWVVANDRFVAVYNTKEEAINHIKFQKEQMGSTAKWYYQYIKMSFGEHGTLDQENTTCWHLGKDIWLVMGQDSCILS